MMDKFFEKGVPVAFAILRGITAWRLLDGTWPYVSRESPVQDVADFSESLSIPLPSLSAYISLYVQFIASILLFIGWQTRIISLLLFINFSVAILAAHLHDPISKSFQAWALLGIAILFLFDGAGKYSLDVFWQRYKKIPSV